MPPPNSSSFGNSTPNSSVSTNQIETVIRARDDTQAGISSASASFKQLQAQAGDTAEAIDTAGSSMQVLSNQIAIAKAQATAFANTLSSTVISSAKLLGSALNTTALTVTSLFSTLSSGTVASVGGITLAFQTMNAVAQQPIVQNLFQQMYEDAIESTKEVQKLSDVVSAFSKLAVDSAQGGFIAGFLGIEPKKIQSTEDIARERVTNLVDNIKKVITKKIGENVSSDSDRNLLLKFLPQALINGSLGQFLSDKIKDQFNNYLVGQIKSRIQGALSAGFSNFSVGSFFNLAQLTLQIRNSTNLFRDFEDILIDRLTQSYTGILNKASELGNQFSGSFARILLVLAVRFNSQIRSVLDVIIRDIGGAILRIISFVELANQRLILAIVSSFNKIGLLGNIVSKVFIDLGNRFSGLGQTIVTKITSFYTSIIQSFNGIGQRINSVRQVIGNSITSLSTTLLSILTQSFGNIGRQLGNLAQTIITPIGLFYATIIQSLGGIGQRLNGIRQFISNSIASFYTNLFSVLTRAFGNIGRQLSNVSQIVAISIKSFYTTIIQAFSSIGQRLSGITQSVFRAFSSFYSTLTQVFGNFGSSLGAIAQSVFGSVTQIYSVVSQAFLGFGQKLIQASNPVTNSVRTVFNSIGSAFVTAGSKLSTSLNSVFQFFGDQIGGAISELLTPKIFKGKSVGEQILNNLLSPTVNSTGKILSTDLVKNIGQKLTSLFVDEKALNSGALNGFEKVQLNLIQKIITLFTDISLRVVTQSALVRGVIVSSLRGIFAQINLPDFGKELLEHLLADNAIAGWALTRSKEIGKSLSEFLEKPTRNSFGLLTKQLNNSLIDGLEVIGNKLPASIKTNVTEKIVAGLRETNRQVGASLVGSGVGALVAGLPGSNPGFGMLANRIATQRMLGKQFSEIPEVGAGAEVLLGQFTSGKLGINNGIGRSIVQSVISSIRQAFSGANLLDVSKNLLTNIASGTAFNIVAQFSKNPGLAIQASTKVREFVQRIFQPLQESDKQLPMVQQRLLAFFRGIVAVIQQAFKLIGKISGFRDFVLKLDKDLNGALSEIATTAIDTFYERITARLKANASRGVGNLFQPLTSGLIRNLTVAFDYVDKKVIQLFSTLRALPGKVEGVVNALTGPTLFLAGLDIPAQVFGEIQGGLGNFAAGVNNVAQQIFFFQSAFLSIQQLVANGPFDLLIKQNVELQKQLLETQASLVATNKIFQNGVQITDPTAAIVKLNAPVQAAISDLRKGALEISGLTSRELVGIFETVSRQSSAIGINLRQAARLSLDFAAAMGTSHIPLEQAQVEINDILQGTISGTNALAKNLTISGAQSRELITQGKLYEILEQKLKAFRAGNALQSQTLDGVTSNIREVIQLTTQSAGKPLLDLIVDQLNRLYQFLSANQSNLQEYLSGIVGSLISTGNSLVRIVDAVTDSMGSFLAAIPSYLFRELAAGADLFANSITQIVTFLKPFFELLTQLSQLIILSFLGPVSQAAITLITVNVAIKVLATSFRLLLTMMPILGHFLLYDIARTAALGNQFAFLLGATGKLNIALGLLAGQNLRQIPLLFNAVASSIPIFGNLIAGFVPQLSGLAIALIKWNKTAPVGAIVQELAGSFGVLTGSIATVASGRGMGVLGGELEKLSGKLIKASTGTNLLSQAEDKIREISKTAGAAFAAQAVSLGLVIGAVVIAGIAFNEFMQRNKDAAEPLRKVSDQLEESAKKIHDSWTQVKKDAGSGLSEISKAPPTDWIDTYILKTRELENGTFRIKNWGDAFLVIAIGIGKAIQDFIIAPIVLGSKTLVNVFGYIAQVIKDIVTFNWKKLADDTAEYQRRIAKDTQEFGQTVSQGFNDTSTKTEKYINDITKLLNSGKLQQSIKDQSDSIDQLIKNASKTGEIYNKQLQPVKDAFKSFQEGKSNVDDVIKSLQELPDAIPQDQQQNLIDFFRTNFHDGVEKSKDAIDQFNSKLDLTNVEASNVAVEAYRKQLEDTESQIKENIDTLEKYGQGNSRAALTLRSLEHRLESTEDRLNKWTQNVDLSPDPVNRLNQALTNLDLTYKQLTASLEADESERIAKASAREAQGLESLRQVEAEKYAATKATQEKQLADITRNLKLVEDQYNKLSPDDKGRAVDQYQKINELRKQAAETQTKLADSQIQEEERLRQNHVDDLERAQKKATDAANISEQERTNALEALYSKDLINKEQLDKAKEVGTISRLKVEEQAQITQYQALSKVKPYDDPEKEAKRQEELRGIRLTALKSTEQRLQEERKLRDTQVAQVLKSIQDEADQENTILQRKLNRGEILESQANTAKAAQNVRKLEAEYNLEKNDSDKKYEISRELEEARTALIAAQVAERKEKIDTQNQEYLNQIEEQNESIKKQQALYDVLTKALEMRNKLQEASKNLSEATSNYLTTELDVLSQTEKSEYRKRQLAEITAAIKLEALKQEQKFERESLEIQIKQNQIALEREAIENRISQGQKAADIAQTQGDIEVLEADPKNQNAAGRAKLRALQLKQIDSAFGLTELQQEAVLIQTQQQNQSALDDAQRRSLELKQKGQYFQALGVLANSLPPGRQQRAQRALQQEISEDFGSTDYRSFRESGVALSRKLASEELGTPNSPDILGAVNPELGGLGDVLTPSQFSSAVADTLKQYYKQYNGSAGFSGLTPNPNAPPLQLPTELQGNLKLPVPQDKITPNIGVSLAQLVPELQDKINALVPQNPKERSPKPYRSGNTSPTQLLPEYQNRLNLPGPQDRSLGFLDQSGKVFLSGVDKFNAGVERFIKSLDQQSNNSNGYSSGTFNINVTTPLGNSSTTSSTSTPVTLEGVVKKMQQLTGN